MKIMDQIVTTIVSKLEQGVVPWHQPWNGGGRPGRNVIYNKPYRGVNWFITALSDYACSYWLTFNQAKQLGGHVIKGQKGTRLVYVNWKEVEKNNKKTLIPVYGTTVVYNLLQCEIPHINLPMYAVNELTTPQTRLDQSQRLIQAEQIVEGYTDCPKITHLANRAYYQPNIDIINMPVFSTFLTPEDYYATLFHEIIHSTGGQHRLDRPEITTDEYTFGSYQYGVEELIAEMGSARLCWQAGIYEHTVDQSASYIDNWITAIREKPSIILTAAARAEAAADYVLGVEGEDDERRHDGGHPQEHTEHGNGSQPEVPVLGAHVQ